MKRFMQEIIACAAFGALALGAGACEQQRQQAQQQGEQALQRGQETIEKGREMGRDVLGGGQQQGQEGTTPEMEQVRYQRSDQALQWEVSRALSEPSFSEYREIDTKVQNGVVTLTGEVPSQELKQSAMQAVKAVPGVQEVKDEIQVNPQMAPAQTVNDEQLQSQIQRELEAQRMDDVNAQVQNGNVTLTGEVDSYQRANELMEGMKDIEGIKSVRTNLRIQEAQQQPGGQQPGGQQQPGGGQQQPGGQQPGGQR